MRKTNWKDIAELIGIVSIVASLIFVGLQMQQAEDIAMAELNASDVSTNIDLAALINEHTDVWRRGNAGESLNPDETIIYENLLKSMNDVSFFGYLMYGERLGHESGTITLTNFASFLHENPGARRVWEAREDRLIRDRNILIPEVNDQSIWRDTIQAHLETLDQWQADNGVK